MKNRPHNKLNLIPLTVMTLLICACGGGGGGSSSPTPTATATATPTSTPTSTPTPTVTTTPTPTPVASSLSISEITVDTTGAVSLSGTSAFVDGAITVTFEQADFQTTPASDGSWSVALSSACDPQIANGNYNITAAATDTDSAALADSGTFSVNANIFTVAYERPSGDYTGWGVHLWNFAGEAVDIAALNVSWDEPYPFTCEENGWAIAKIPYLSDTATLGVILHKGNIKNTQNDLLIEIQNYPDGLWVAQSHPDTFTSAAAADAAKGNYSASVDTSTVAVTNAASALPANWNESANFMEVFVRSFKDSDGDGNGDFQGLISELDYLQALGINGLWLMPITESYDNDHGYSVLDYRSVEADYGTMQDFQELLTEAHARNIGIVIDYVINHSSRMHPIFLDANSSTTNDKRDWYLYDATDLGWGPWGDAWHESVEGDFYYGAFNQGLPDFNLANADVEAFHLNNLRFWMNMGVDGFRLDAVGVLFEDSAGTDIVDNNNNHTFLNTVLNTVNAYDNRYLVCEAPEDTIPYAQPTSCGKAFAFDTQWNILDSARDHAVKGGLITQLNRSNHDDMPLFLSNHDSFAGGRPYSYLTTCGGSCSHISTSNVDNYLKMASAISLLTSPTPFTYYGEEVGMSGLQGSDTDLRTPMSWEGNATTAGFTTGTPYRDLAANVLTNNVADQDAVDDSLLNHYRDLLALRLANPVLSLGTLNVQSLTGNSYLVFTRDDGVDAVAVLINLSTTAQTLQVEVSASTDFITSYPNTAVIETSDGSGVISVDVPAQSLVVLVQQ